MTGREFVAALEKYGFTVRRRSKSFVWLLRGEQSLMVDEESTVPDAFLERLLASAPPPSRRPSRSGALSMFGSSPRETPKA